MLPTLCRAARPAHAPWALYARRVRFASSVPPPTPFAAFTAGRRTLSSSRPFFDANTRVPPPPAPLPGTSAAQTPPVAPAAPHIYFRRTRRVFRWGAYLAFSSVLGLSAITGGIFLHDAFTYNSAHVDRVPVNPLALHPETGGPKNLPVVSSYLGDEEDEENRALSSKPRLVIVGGGWGVCVSSYVKRKIGSLFYRPSASSRPSMLATTTLLSFHRTRSPRSPRSCHVRKSHEVENAMSLTLVQPLPSVPSPCAL
jgi:hypothetical protein